MGAFLIASSCHFSYLFSVFRFGFLSLEQEQQPNFKKVQYAYSGALCIVAIAGW